MGIFDNSKVKKWISVILASFSIGGTTGCKQDETRDESVIENTQMSLKNDTSGSGKDAMY